MSAALSSYHSARPSRLSGAFGNDAGASPPPATASADQRWTRPTWITSLPRSQPGHVGTGVSRGAERAAAAMGAASARIAAS